MPGFTGRDASRTAIVVPAPTTCVVRIRRTETDTVELHPGTSRQLSGTSGSQGSPPGAGCPGGVRRIAQAVPVNASRARAFQYSGSAAGDPLTPLPVGRQVD